MYTQIKNQLQSLNNSTYINKVNNIKFNKHIKIQKQYLGKFIYNILQINNIYNTKIYNTVHYKYYNSNIIKKIQTDITKSSDKYIDINNNCNSNSIDFDILEQLFNSKSINNFCSIKKYEEENNTIDIEYISIIKYYCIDIVNINNINNWLIIDENKTHNQTYNQTYFNICKYSNGTINYNINSNIDLCFDYADITISISFLKVINNYYTLNISFNMNLDIKSNIINKRIDDIIYILKSIDTALTII